LICHRI